MVAPKLAVYPHSVAIVGWHEGGAGQIDSWLEESGEFHVACFLHPSDEALDIDPSRVPRDASQFSYPTADSFKDRPLYYRSDWAAFLREQGIRRVLVTEGDEPTRMQLIERARRADLELVSAIHPSVRVMADAILGHNIILHAGVHVGYRAEIHTGASVNTGSIIEHHDVISMGATIDPGVVLAGNVTVGPLARVHTGARVINRIRLGARAVVGAGAVVIRDVPEGATVVGVPARPVG